jgi:hypothetical protein
MLLTGATFGESPEANRMVIATAFKRSYGAVTPAYRS